MAVLRSFCTAVGAVAQSGQGWRWPISAWAEEAACPDEVRTFVRHAYAFETASEQLLGRFQPLLQHGACDTPFVTGRTEAGTAVDLLPIRARFASDDTLYTFLYPLGVEMLFEGNAHVHALNTVGRAPDLSPALLHRDRYGFRFSDEGRPKATEPLLPYEILQSHLGQVLHDKGSGQATSASVLAVSDELLARAVLAIELDAATETQAESPSLGATLDALLSRLPAETLATGTFEASPALDDIYSCLAAELAQVGPWQEVKQDGMLQSSIDLWEAFVIETCILPLIALRRVHGHGLFRTVEGTFRLYKAVPPPVISMGGGRRCAYQIACVPSGCIS